MAKSTNALRNLRAQLAKCRASGARGPTGVKSQEANMVRSLQQKIGSANWNNWQMTRWCYFDYVRYTAAGVTELNFFANPVGSVDPVSTLTKTHEQTNITKTRTFGQVYFVIQQIRTHVFLLPKGRQNATVIADADAITTTYRGVMTKIYDLLNAGVLQIKLGQKDYFDIPQPFRLCPPGFGVDIQSMAHGDGAQTAGTNNMVWIAQDNQLNEVYNVTPPQMVEPEQNVEARITFDDATSPNVATSMAGGSAAAIDIGLIFDGYVIRPSQ